jgi:O-antigen/teichoic acid export membrane protein/aminoglycoside phosphotransferase (APT) family kinase protein
MSGQASTEFPAAARVRHLSRRSALAAHLRTPLYRDGYALVLNAGLTALLGLAYWLIAAHDYTPHAVGVNTAAISAMMFLAGVAQLNLMSAVVRFVPILRGLRGRFIAACYLVAAVAAVGCSAVFLLGVSHWAPALGVLGSTPGMIAWFVGATVAWCVFNLQDSALTGLGAAVLVPVENAVYGIAKIVLLVALVSASPRYGIFGSWTGGLIPSMVVVNILIFGPLLRRRPAAPAEAVEVPTRRDIVRFAAPDYLAALAWLAATTLMPVIVVAVAGATSNAYFSLAWMIVGPIAAASASMGVALVATAAPEPHRLPEYARGVMRRTAWLTVPAAVVLALASPLVLSVFGRQYAAHGAITLSLLALMTIPNTITALYTSIYRAQRRMRRVVKLQAGLCGSVLVLAPPMLEAFGIAGVGLDWLVCQTVVATVLLCIDGAAVSSGTRGPLVPAGRRGPFDLAADLGLVSALRTLRADRFRRRHAAELSRCVPAGKILTGIEPSVTDVVVGHARGRFGGDSVFVKLARTANGDESLRRASERLAALDADPRVCGWDVPRPRILASDTLDRHWFVVESALSGVTMAQLLAQGDPWEPLARQATAAIEGLHRRTAELVTVDSALLERWVYAPLHAVEPIVARSRRRTKVLRELSDELAAQLEHRQVIAGWIHGDFVPSNVLMDRGGTVTGIVDWELAAPLDLPAIDRTMLLLATHMQIARRELGQVAAAVVTGRASGSLRAALAQAAAIDDSQPLDARALTILSWLRHAALLVTQSERYSHHVVWSRYNVFEVIDALERR